MQQTTLSAGVVAFPDYPFADLPKQPGDIMETIQITGSSTQTTQAVGGTADQAE